MQLLDENCARNQVTVKESFFSVDGKIFACEAKKNCFLPLFETNIKAIKKLLENGKDITKINETNTNDDVFEDKSNNTIWRLYTEGRESIRLKLFSVTDENTTKKDKYSLDPKITSYVLPLLKSQERMPISKTLKNNQSLYSESTVTKIVNDTSELEQLIEHLIEHHIAVLFTLSCDATLGTFINVSYRYLLNFKEEYQIVDIGKEHCLIMKIF